MRLIENINGWIGRQVSWVIFILVGIVVYSVITRYLFSSQNIWAYETSQYLFGVHFVLGGGYVLINQGHVKVDVVYNHLSLKGRAIIDLVTSLFFFLFIGPLVWFGWKSGWQSLQMMERTETAWSPLIFPIKLTIPVGAFLLLMQWIVKFIQDLQVVKGEKTNER